MNAWKTYPRKHGRVFRKFDQGIWHKSMQLYLRGRKESDMTKQLNWTELISMGSIIYVTRVVKKEKREGVKWRKTE